jgi:hypothetical protein
MTVARAGNIVVAVNPDGSNIGSSGVSGAVTVTSGSVTAVPFAASTIGSNSAPITTPLATNVIATASSGAAGTYDVKVTTNVGGTVAAIDQANLNLVNGGQIIRLANGTGSSSSNFEAQLVLGAGAAINVAAVANGTTGSIYAATIMLTRTA